MADNLTTQTTVATIPTATTIATDDVSGTHYQKVKLVDGTADSATAIPGDATNGLDVDVTRLPALVAGTANIGDVDVLTVPAPLSTTGGGTEATAHRVTIASDSTGVLTVKQATAANLNATIVDASLDNATLVDNAGFTDGTTRLMMAGYILDDTAGTALTENDAAAPRISTNRATVGVIEDGATRARYATVTAANALKVDASGVAVPVTDNAGSLTVDAPNGTPVFARLTDATLNVGVVDETGASAVDALAAGGGTPHDSVDSGNPLKIGMKAATSVPTAVAAADRVNAWGDVYGRPIVQLGVPVGTEKWATAQYTTTQTGTALLTPTAGKKLVITYIQIQVGGTTAGTLQVWFGGSADTTYTRGTDRAIFDGEFAPSATLKPGFTATKESGWIAINADDILRVTDSAAINPLTVTAWGYEV